MLCDGLFPSGRSLELEEALEEERRLFYVAITRAKKNLYLSYPIIRMAQGYSDFMQQKSRFLNELPSHLMEELVVKPTNPWGAYSEPYSQRKSDPEEFDQEDPF